MEKYGPEIAAIIVEPIPGNMGVVLPEPAFLKGLRELTSHCGSLFIFDEVIDKPSELLAAMDIPLKLVQAIVALPTSLVQFKLNYSTEQTKLLSKQLEEIKARQELEDYLKKGKPPDSLA